LILYIFSTANSLAGIKTNIFFYLSTTYLILGAYEYLTKKANGRNTDVSRLFIYYNARAKANNSDSVEDSGCSMTDAIEALEEFGTCLESIWPYDISNVNTRPDDQAYQQAEGHKIREALQVNLNLDEMKSCLAQGFPIAFGLKLFTSFDQAREAGVVPMPNVSDGTRQSDGRSFGRIYIENIFRFLLIVMLC
jgi:hypothetical protein